MPGCLVISDFNANNFCAYLENDKEAPALEPIEAPFGLVQPILSDAAHPIWQTRSDFAVVWTQPEKTVPSFQRVLEGEVVPAEALLAEVDAFCSLLLAAAARVGTLFVPAWVHDPADRGHGMADWKRGIQLALTRLNLRLAEGLSAPPNAFVLDAQRWVAHAGIAAFNPKLWYQGKIPFGNPVFRAAVKDVKASARGVRGEARKLIILDLDETLWGGVVGDVGWEHLRLGGHDGVGEAFVEFQRALKALTRRGIILAIVSKNQENLALEAVGNHPEMHLRLEDFAAWRINWEDKAANIVDLVTGLNLGLQSAVFIDDNPMERARVREALPEVLVPEWPESPMLYRSALLGLHCFDTPSLSTEDRARAHAYTTERQRSSLKQQAGSLEEWLKGLAMEVIVEPLSTANLARAAQLLNKTNQMNLATRRMTENEYKTWAETGSNRVWTFRVTDKFGDSGLTGLASLQVDNGCGRIPDFVLSCRVMGRKVEETMVHWVVENARQAGAREVRAEYSRTAKNQPCLEFWQRSGFAMRDSSTFVWDTAQAYPVPDGIRLRTAPPQ